MDLTLESAFSVGGLVGHTSYLLLVGSMLMRTMFRLRILVIASALVAINRSGGSGGSESHRPAFPGADGRANPGAGA